VRWIGPFVALVLMAGCSQSSGGQTQATPEAGAQEASTCSAEGCGASDAAVDVAPFDAGWVCPLIPESDVGAGCDACIQSSCDAPWCTCAQDQQVNDAGTQGCLTSVSCGWSCPADAGDSGACGGCGEGAFTAAQQQEGQALLSCIAQSCATACAGLAGVAL
jgi:hypothetical protein